MSFEYEAAVGLDAQRTKHFLDGVAGGPAWTVLQRTAAGLTLRWAQSKLHPAEPEIFVEVKSKVIYVSIVVGGGDKRDALIAWVTQVLHGLDVKAGFEEL